MSRLGRLLLSICDNDLSIDLGKVMSLYPKLDRGTLEDFAKNLGLRIQWVDWY